jgi:hypothetical protein
MSVSKRMISVLSVMLVTLMALTAVVPAFAAVATKDQSGTPATSERALGIAPGPKGVLHVAKIGVEDLPWSSIGYRQLAIHVVIVDEDGSPVEGAAVFGQLKVAAFDPAPLAGKTDVNGEAVLESLIPRASGAAFCVTDVVKEGYVYDAKGNEMTCLIVLPQEGS